MPYEGEFAGYGPLRRLADSQRVRDLLNRSRVRSTQAETGEHEILQKVSADDVGQSDWDFEWVLAVDGSHAEAQVKNGYPGAEVSYVTVASVLLDVAKMAELDAARPVDPVEFRTTEQAESIDAALPGCNVVVSDQVSAVDSFRKEMFEVFKDIRMAPDGESLLDTYEDLLEFKPQSPKGQDCPCEDCPDPEEAYKKGCGKYTCTCAKRQTLYSVDALRIHEGMNAGGTNGAMFAEIMQVWERVWIVHVLRTLEKKQWLYLLRPLAIVLDGPLAVHGHPAWLSQAISHELARINKEAKRMNGLDILMLGVEKSGRFVDHFAQLDEDVSGQRGVFPERTAALLTDEYIKQNVIFSNSDKPYGRDTYFGRKIFYKTRAGSRVVATIPFFTENQRDATRAEVQQFPRLGDALSLLDRLVSSQYPNALTPLVSAHKEAAIPLHLGNRVLEDLARRLIREESHS